MNHLAASSRVILKELTLKFATSGEESSLRVRRSQYYPYDPSTRSGSVRLNNFVSQNYSLTDLKAYRIKII